MSNDSSQDPLPTAAFIPDADAPSTVDATRAAQSTNTTGRRLADPPAGAPNIPGYAITEKIARGGMGQVYAAFDLTFGREAAIKTLIPSLVENSSVASRFVIESKITGRLHHPGIPPAYAMGTLDDGSPYLVMKLIRGRTLDALIKDRSSPAQDLQRFVQIFEQIAQAVGFAHEQGVVHRDLKPGNVMVGAFGEVQVMDWGLAKDLAGSASNVEGIAGERISDISDENITQPGSILGTPAFMPPEQARGGEIDARADVFSLGAILATILTGKPAYVAATSQETIQESLKGDLSGAWARLDASKSDPELVALAKHCLSANPDDRPSNAHVVAEKIAAYRAGVEARLRRAETEAAAAQLRDVEQRRRRRLLIGSGATIIVALAFGLGISLWQMTRALSAEAQAEFDRDAKGTALEAEKSARAAERQARDRTLEALQSMTDEIVEQQMARGSTLTEENKAFLKKIIEQFERFAAVTSEDAESRFIRSEGLARVGTMRHRLGEVKEAESSLNEALAIRKALAAEFPTNAKFIQGLALVNNNLANLMFDTGRKKESEGMYLAASKSLEGLVDEKGGGEIGQQLASVYNNLAVLMRELGRPNDVAEYWNRSIPLSKRLVERFPNRQNLARDLAGSYSSLAKHYIDAGKIDQADAAQLEALNIQTRLIASSPKNPQYRLELAMSHSTVGDTNLDVDRFKEAEASYDRGLVLLRELAAEFPTQPNYRHELSRTLNKKCILLQFQRRIVEAKAAYEELINLRRKLAAEFPKEPEYRRELASTLNGLGVLRSKKGDRKESETAYLEAREIQRKLVAEFPRQADYKRHLAGTLNNLGLLLSDSDRRKEAGVAFDEAMEIRKKLAEDSNGDPDSANAVAGGYVNLAFFHINADEYSAAAVNLKSAEPLHSAALKANSRNPQYREFYRNYLAALTITKAGLNDQPEALRSAVKLRDMGWDPPSDSLFAARALAASCKAVAPTKEKDDAPSAYAEEAVKTLRMAVERGLKDSRRIKEEPSFAPLRQRSDFKALVAEMESTNKKAAIKK